MKDINTLTSDLNNIYRDQFEPEIKKGSRFKNAHYIDAIDAIYELKSGINDESILKHLIWICEMNQDLSKTEYTTRWNRVVYLGATALTLVTIMSFMHDLGAIATTVLLGLVVLVSIVMLCVILSAEIASVPTRREAFYSLALKILTEENNCETKES